MESQLLSIEKVKRPFFAHTLARDSFQNCFLHFFSYHIRKLVTFCSWEKKLAMSFPSNTFIPFSTKFQWKIISQKKHLNHLYENLIQHGVGYLNTARCRRGKYCFTFGFLQKTIHV